MATANGLMFTPPIVALAKVGAAVVLKSCGLLIVIVVPIIPTVMPLLLANVKVPLLVLIGTAVPPAVPVTDILAFVVVTYPVKVVVKLELVTYEPNVVVKLELVTYEPNVVVKLELVTYDPRVVARLVLLTYVFVNVVLIPDIALVSAVLVA